MHRNFMSTLPHCKSAQAVFKHVVRKVGVTVALKSESVHPDSCPCYRESVENQLWVCWTPIFYLCVLPPAEAMEVAQMALQSTQSCQTSGLSALQGVSLSQETLQGIDVNREKKEKKRIHTLRMHKSTWLFKNYLISLSRKKRRATLHTSYGRGASETWRPDLRSEADRNVPTHCWECGVGGKEMGGGINWTEMVLLSISSCI